MVRASPSDLGTIRAAGSLGSSAGTMIEHGGTMESQMGTMVINTDDEDEDAGTMKSKCTLTPTQRRPYTPALAESIKVSRNIAIVTVFDEREHKMLYIQCELAS